MIEKIDSEAGEYVCIEVKTLEDLLREKTKLSYTVMLLEYVCRRCDIEGFLSAEEFCEATGISSAKIEKSAQKKEVRSVIYKGVRMYQASDLINLLEKYIREKIHRAVDSIPRIVAEKPY